MLSAMRDFVRTMSFIASTPPEAQLSINPDIAYHDKMQTATAKVRWYSAKHREGMCCFQKYSRVCITRAAVNESTTVSTSILTIAEVFL